MCVWEGYSCGPKEKSWKNKDPLLGPGVMSVVLMSLVELLQRLIQKEKVHIDYEKDAQISILANKIATQWWPNITVKESNPTIHYIFYFLVIMFTLCCWFDQKPGIAFNSNFSFT